MHQLIQSLISPSRAFKLLKILTHPPPPEKIVFKCPTYLFFFFLKAKSATVTLYIKLKAQTLWTIFSHLHTSKLFTPDTSIFKDVALEERCFFILSRAWDKEKILSPHESSLKEFLCPKKETAELEWLHQKWILSVCFLAVTEF